MAVWGRRSFLTAAAVLPALAARCVPGGVEESDSEVWAEPQSYGTAGGRRSFAIRWTDSEIHRFEHRDFPHFHRLRTNLDTRYSRCRQSIPRLQAGPLFLRLKLLCTGEAGRTLFTLGLKSRALGNWAFSLGACPTHGISFGIKGWQILVNAADPWRERTRVPGLDHRDWHTWVLVIPDAAGPARIYCDGRYLMDLKQPITAAQRDKIAREQNGRHGSIQQLVPETPGEGDYAFLESRHPGQELDIDGFELSTRAPATARTSLPVLLDLDWELRGTRMVENPLTRFAGNPVLDKAAIPDPSGRGSGGFNAEVIRDGEGFRMYFNGVNRMSQAIGRVTFGLYHAASGNGTDWKVTPATPVLSPGAPGAWDAGSLGQAGVLKDGHRFRMWYGGYVDRLQQGRAGYAESADGVHWRKPELGLVRFGGQQTNICFSLQPGLNSNEYELPVEVIRDEAAPPERRYLMFLHTQGPQGFIVDVATSPDGRRFVRAPHNARHYAFDEVPRNSTLHGAAVVLKEDSYWWAFVGHHEAGGGGYRMRFTGWATEPEEKDNIGFGLWDSRGIQLEPNGQPWEQGEPRVSSFLEVGKEWWIYYSSGGSIGLARVGRHRLYGLELEAGRQMGQITSLVLSPPQRGWRRQRLTVNVSGLSGGGRLQAELLDGVGRVPLEGFTLAQSVPVEQDGYEVPLRWEPGGAQLPETPEPLRVRLRMTRGGGHTQLHGLYVRARRRQ